MPTPRLGIAPRATLRSIERRGHAQTTVSDIADVLGVTRRTIYRYFATTGELFAAVADIAVSSPASKTSPRIWM
jgi:AcrR family transcriptional regulator